MTLSIAFSANAPFPETVCILRRHLMAVGTDRFDATPLNCAVSIVISMRSHEKMSRVYADWIIATMANQETGGDFSPYKFKRYAMRQEFLIFSATKLPAPIRNMSPPCPALVEAADFDL